MDNFPELQGGTRELRKIFLDKIPVLKISDETNIEFENLVYKLQSLVTNNEPTTEIETIIEEKIFDLFSLTREEREVVGAIQIQ